jgi:potassium inwardly-rectifying channel subfamily J
LEIEDFASCFLFSLETQHTIGYGSRQTTNECTSAIIAMSLQSIMGCLIQAFMVGIVFAKLSRPQSRSKTIVFSKQAVVCERNRKLCMVFRIGDMRHNSFIVNASLSVKVIRRRVTEEGEMYHETSPIKIKPDSAEEPCVFLIWPITVIHIIDSESPFFKYVNLKFPSFKSDFSI